MKLMKNWKIIFSRAQKYILEPKGYDKAKDILLPYRGISEKTAVELLKNFRSLKRIKEVSEESIAEVVSKAKAAIIYNHYHPKAKKRSLSF